MKINLLLILTFILAKALHAQTKHDTDSIIAIALMEAFPHDTLKFKSNLKTLNSIEKRSSLRRIRSRKKLDGLRNYITILGQLKANQLDCSSIKYHSLEFKFIAKSNPVNLDSIKNIDPVINSGKSKAAIAQKNIYDKNFVFQSNQLILLTNQQKILNDTRAKIDTLLRQSLNDQRNALEEENKNRWQNEVKVCEKNMRERMNRLEIEITNLKKVYPRAYRRYLIKHTNR